MNQFSFFWIVSSSGRFCLVVLLPQRWSDTATYLYMNICIICMGERFVTFPLCRVRLYRARSGHQKRGFEAKQIHISSFYKHTTRLEATTLTRRVFTQTSLRQFNPTWIVLWKTTCFEATHIKNQVSSQKKLTNNFCDLILFNLIKSNYIWYNVIKFKSKCITV